jgi:hypothetical protein
MTNAFLNAENKISGVSCFNRVIELTSLLQSEEVSHPKTINIKLYLITNNFSVNNRHFVIKSSQATQLYIAIQGKTFATYI